MQQKKFLAHVEERLKEDGVNEKTIDYVTFKLKQSFRNGVSVGRKEVSGEKREGKTEKAS